MATISNTKSKSAISSIDQKRQLCGMSSENAAGSKNTRKGECLIKYYNFVVLPNIPLQPNLDLGESLISLGFARIVNPNVPKHITDALTKDEQLKRYRINLEKVEIKAKTHRMGLWSTKIPPPPWPVRFVKKQISNVLYNHILPAKHRLPELVR